MSGQEREAPLQAAASAAANEASLAHGQAQLFTISSSASHDTTNDGPSLRYATSLTELAARASTSSYGASLSSELLGGSAPASFDEHGGVGLPAYALIERQSSPAHQQATDHLYSVSSPGQLQQALSTAAGTLQSSRPPAKPQLASEGTQAGPSVPSGGSHGQPPNQSLEEARPVCAFFKRTGTCAYGDRCKFIHPSDCPPPKLNQRGYPIRPEEPDCPHYVKKGWCAFGATCKFHHQDSDAPLAQLLAAAAGTPGAPAGYGQPAGLHGRLGVAGPAGHPYLALGGQQQLPMQAGQAAMMGHLNPSSASMYPYSHGPSVGMNNNTLYYLSQGGVGSISGAGAMGGVQMGRGAGLGAQAAVGMGGGLSIASQQRASGFTAGDYAGFAGVPAGGAGGYGQPQAGAGAMGTFSMAGGGGYGGGVQGGFLPGQQGGGAMAMGGGGFLPGGGGSSRATAQVVDASALNSYMASAAAGSGHGARAGYQHGAGQRQGGMQMRMQQHQGHGHGQYDEGLDSFDGMMAMPVPVAMGMSSLGDMGGMRGQGQAGQGAGGMYEGAGVGGMGGVTETMVSSQLASAMQRLRMREGK